MNSTNAELTKEAKVINEGDTDVVELKNGAKVKIYKCKTRQIGEVVGFISDIFDDVVEKDEEGNPVVNEGQIMPKIQLDNPKVILQLLAKKGNKLFSVASGFTNISSETIDSLEVDDSLKIVGKVWEVNSDFFSRSVVPALLQILPEEAKAQI